MDVDRITILTMCLKKLQTLQFWCFQHKVQIGIREHFCQDFKAKLVSDPIFVSFHFSLYFYLVMQCRSKVRFIGGPITSAEGLSC